MTRVDVGTVSEPGRDRHLLDVLRFSARLAADMAALPDVMPVWAEQAARYAAAADALEAAWIEADGLAAQLLGLRAAVEQALVELDLEHDATDEPAIAQRRGGCRMCWPRDGGWPCITRSVADDLRAALELSDPRRANP